MLFQSISIQILIQTVRFNTQHTSRTSTVKFLSWAVVKRGVSEEA